MLDQGSWIALALSVVLLLVAGLWHLVWIRALNSLDRRLTNNGNLSVILAFWGIAILHLSEIAIAAAVYAWAVNGLGLGTLGDSYGGTPADFVYFAGITYTSLGFAHEHVTGPVRMLAMVNSLAGLMLITWSATYVYTIWGSNFRDNTGG